MRNPWGEGEWSGDWSDNFLEMNPLAKQKIKLEYPTYIMNDDGGYNDGTFHIPFEDYIKQYSCTSFNIDLQQKQDNEYIYNKSSIFRSFKKNEIALYFYFEL